MIDETLKSAGTPIQHRSWCVEWFGSQGDFIAGKAVEPGSLQRFAGLESLYAVGPLADARGEISIYDSAPLISEVRDGQASVSIDFSRRAAFLVYTIVENWWRATIRGGIAGEQQLGEQLLPFAVESGIDVDQPFPFLVHCHIEQAMFHVLCNQSQGEYSPEQHEKAKVRFSIARESVEILGFYSRRHRGIFTPRDSDFHMHVRTLDNRLSGHLETFDSPQGITLYLPTNERGPTHYP
jgi:acetolactate decarboxylase